MKKKKVTLDDLDKQISVAQKNIKKNGIWGKSTLRDLYAINSIAKRLLRKMKTKTI